MNLPSSLESERSLLCSYFLSPNDVGPLLAERRFTPGHFHLPAHQEVFTALQALWSEGLGVDIITVTERLRKSGTLDASGGASFVCEVSGYIPTWRNAPQYVETVLAYHKLRTIIQTCSKAAQESHDPASNPDGIIEGLSNKLMGLCGEVEQDEPDIQDLVHTVTQELDDAFQNQGKPKDCVSTGFDQLDGFLNGGIRKSDTIVISAPAKGGKSLFSDNIMEHIAINLEKPVALFTLETPANERVKRILSSNSRVPMTAMIMGWMNQGHVMKIDASRKRLMGSKMTIRSKLQTFTQIQAAIRQCKVRFPDLALVVIDYLQLVEGERQKNDNKEVMIGDISRKFRLMAISLEVPFILISQENDDGRARDSRRIEMDCTTMLRVRDGKEEGTKLVEVALNRNGPNGSFVLTHLKECLRLENHTHSSQ